MQSTSAARHPASEPSPTLRPLVTSASEDIFRGLAQWRVYGRLGWLEMKRRYRRTVLGPLWSTVSLALTVSALGAIGVQMWNQPAATYVPFLAAGLIVWVMIQNIVNESTGLFISNQNLFRQMRMDYSVLAYSLVWRNLIAAMHNLVVFLAASAIFTPQNLSWRLLLVAPGLVLIGVNAVWIALLLGMACLRFRDLQQLTSNVVQIAIFVTPIFWPPEVLRATRRVVFVTLNPLYHMIEVVRVPLTNRVPSTSTYIAALVITVVGWTVTYILFARFRKRIAYWS